MSDRVQMERAKKYCETNTYRFTAPRERVLAVLLASGKSMGAYAILAELSSEEQKMNAPTVYRAIDFWVKHGFIHKVESTNTYIACCHHGCSGHFCLFICDQCNVVMELQHTALPKSLEAVLQQRQLTVSRSTTEIHGRCAQCH